MLNQNFLVVNEDKLNDFLNKIAKTEVTNMKNGDLIEFRHFHTSKNWEKATFVCYTPNGFVINYQGAEALFSAGTISIRPYQKTDEEKRLDSLEEIMIAIGKDVFNLIKSRSNIEEVEKNFFNVIKREFESARSPGE